MKVVKPTKNEVFNSLRNKGCCWVGGQSCFCYSRQIKMCYDDEEVMLTKVIKTDEEIAEERKINEKVMEELYQMLDFVFEL